MKVDYLKQRVSELFTYVDYLKTAADEDTKNAGELIQKVKTSTDEEERMDMMKGFKKIQFFNNMKLVEMERTMPILVELVSIAQVTGLDLELTEDQELIIETNKKRITPMYVVDKNELTFLNKDIEAAVDKELDNPSATDVDALRKILKAVDNGI